MLHYFVECITLTGCVTKPVELRDWVTLKSSDNCRVKRRTEAEFACHVIECGSDHLI
jgi:hypothetical protein